MTVTSTTKRYTIFGVNRRREFPDTFYTLKELQRNASAIMDRVAKGEVITIRHYNKPIAEIRPVNYNSVRPRVDFEDSDFE